MRELPKSIDADVVIEISRLLDDRAKSAPVPVHKLASMISNSVETDLPTASIEQLIVEMAMTRQLPMLFDLPDADTDNVISIALARATWSRWGTFPSSVISRRGSSARIRPLASAGGFCCVANNNRPNKIIVMAVRRRERVVSVCISLWTAKEEFMNWDQIKGKWMQFKGKAKEQWGDLTDDDLDRIEGNRDQLAGRIQERYGIAKEEAERRVDDWSRSLT